MAMFVLVMMMCLGAYALFVIRPEKETERVLSKRLRKAKDVPMARASRLLKDAQEMSSVGVVNKMLRLGKGRVGRLQELLEQSGTSVNVGKFVLGCGCLAGIAMLGVSYFLHSFVAEVAAAAGVVFVSFSMLQYKRTLRLRKFEEQFPEALDLVARALRAGHSFTTGISMVSEEMPKPLGPEFALLHSQQNYGMPFPDALADFARRIPVLDARFFVTAVLIQRESGGNLSEVLDNLAHVMRERFRVKRQMRVISAHGRITGWVLAGLPPVLGAVIMTINRESRDLMFGDPLGQRMLIAAIALQLIGSLAIRKIVNVEY
jgi:tight adherence protein B